MFGEMCPERSLKPFAEPNAIADQRKDKKLKKRQRDQQPLHPVHEEGAKPLAVVRTGCEVARQHEEKSQHEGAADGRHEHHDDEHGGACLAFLVVIPVPLRAVGDGQMQEDHNRDQGCAQIVDIKQVRPGSGGLNGSLMSLKGHANPPSQSIPFEDKTLNVLYGFLKSDSSRKILHKKETAIPEMTVSFEHSIAKSPVLYLFGATSELQFILPGIYSGKQV